MRRSAVPIILIRLAFGQVTKRCLVLRRGSEGLRRTVECEWGARRFSLPHEQGRLMA
jgi:hypothetical protein